MELSEKLNHAMTPQTSFTIAIPEFTIPFVNINVPAFSIPISETVITMWLIMAFLIIASLLLVRKLKTIPEGKQNFIEAVVEGINSLVKSVLGHHWRPFAPYMGTLLLFLAVSNMISLVNIIPEWEQLYKLTHWEIFEHLPHFRLSPPTKDINFTAALAIMSILLVLFSGIKIKGFTGWLKTFVHPMPVALPFKILDYFVRPLSLCLRLFGNVLAGVTIVEYFLISAPLIIVTAFSFFFDIFDAALQAYVFVFLTSLYIAETIE